MLYFACSGCVSKGRGTEPEWAPKTYKFDSGDKCLFIGDSLTDLIDISDDDFLHDYVLIRADEFLALKVKLQRCERWE